MPGTHYVSRQSDRIDQVTGLPRMPTALAELSGLIRENQPDRQLGIISLAVVTDPLLFRQSADAEGAGHRQFCRIRKFEGVASGWSATPS